MDIIEHLDKYEIKINVGLNPHECCFELPNLCLICEIYDSKTKQYIYTIFADSFQTIENKLNNLINTNQL